MPDLEKCSICGSQILVSNYTWSKKKIICRKCQEFASQINPQNINIDYQDEGNNYSKFNSIPSGGKNILSNKYQIFITWKLITRITFCLLFSVAIVIGGTYTLEHIRENSLQQPIEKL